MHTLLKTMSVVKFIERKDNGGCQGLVRGGMESYCLMGTEFQFCKMKSVLKMDGGDGAQQCECT